MARIWQPQSIDVYLSWVEAIEEEASDKLSEWELGFIESVHNRLLSKINLTEKQESILERIYVEKTS
jgi:hypothetical protein